MHARESSGQELSTRAIEGVDEARLRLAHIAQPNRPVDEEAGAEDKRFDELLACVAGERPPWAARFDLACRLADALSAKPGAPPGRGLPATAAVQRRPGDGREPPEPPRFHPYTLSGLSTSAAARAPAGPATGFLSPRLPLSPRLARLSS